MVDFGLLIDEESLSVDIELKKIIELNLVRIVITNYLLISYMLCKDLRIFVWFDYEHLHVFVNEFVVVHYHEHFDEEGHYKEIEIQIELLFIHQYSISLFSCFNCSICLSLRVISSRLCFNKA